MGPQAWPPQLSLGQKIGVAQLGVGWQQWALQRELGDGIEVILVSNNPGRQASLPCSRDPKGQSREGRRRTPPPAGLIFSALLPAGL